MINRACHARREAIDFLTKPVKKEILFEAVERALARDDAGSCFTKVQ